MFKELTLDDAKEFSELIKNMYAHLENLEWFSPMPFDLENVKSMITNPRFYIVGYFQDGVLCGVSSFDYKCGKLIGKIDFPKECNTDKLVEIGFTMVHSDYKGNGIMKKLVLFLLEKAKDDGFEWVFSKVHIDNFASSKSLLHNGFEKVLSFKKPVNITEFKSLSNADFFSGIGKENAEKTLAKYDAGATEIVVDYDIIIKKI